MSDITLYNTLSRQKEIFKPIKAGEVSMYHCGPTVYDTPHIGNYRTFVLDDLVRRVFEYNEYRVIQVMNVTDVDDKTINRSRENDETLQELTLRYEGLFLEGLQSMNILTPYQLVRATEHVSGMISLISQLLENGTAYKADDGIYMSIAKVKGYGELANLKPSAEKSQERITNDNYDKEDPRDFALWKFKTPADGSASWPAPFGEGRPGWHIECSAMSMELIGSTIDIHTGGIDLIFPHHTNEIAQSESASGHKFVNYWVHGGFVNIGEDKMAKSKGNFIKLEDLHAKAIAPLSYRYWLLTAHYRSPVNFTYEAVQAGQTALIRLMTTIAEMPEGGKVSAEYKSRFTAHINDDLDMPKAVALVWEILKDAKVSDADKRATIIDFDKVLGLKLESVPKASDEAVPAEVTALAEAREEARKSKDWVKADALRDEIEARGFTVKDTAKGIEIKAI